MYIRVENGIVIEVFSDKPVFHADLMKSVFSVNDKAIVGYEFDGIKVSPPKPKPPRDDNEIRAERLAEIRFSLADAILRDDDDLVGRLKLEYKELLSLQPSGR